ncbi:MAG: MltA domain-containing protein [Phycisphaerales bacterium]
MIQARRVAWLGCLMCVVVLAGALPGCKRARVEAPDYSRPLPPGAIALRRITDPARMPDLTSTSRQVSDPAFREALARSLEWYQIPSTQGLFPVAGISHVHAQTSAYAMQQVGQAGSPMQALNQLKQEFDVYESVGWDGSGIVFFTGYYSPVFKASRTQAPGYEFPLYRRPGSLTTDPVSGAVTGTFPPRAQIETSGMLVGTELVWLQSRLDAYIVQVNGSAKLEMTDGSIMYVGYAGNNGYEYTSIGRELVADGKISADRLSLPTLRNYFQEHPDELDGYIQRNDRFVFFREYDGNLWPAGSLGFKVTPGRSLATDKAIFPRGCVVLVTTDKAPTGGWALPPSQLMLDQDTGGAIRAPGRGDIYFGIGPSAEASAGRQAAEGRMYYLLLKRDRVQSWYDRMMAKQ